MKKRIVMLMLIVGIACSGCGKQETEVAPETQVTKDEVIEEESIHDSEETAFGFEQLDDLEFYFASGAGGWRTVLKIEKDGSFSGLYSDSEMGEIGDDYPNGTYYYCEFHGKFSNPVKINDFTYSMRIKEISCVNKPDTHEIIDGMRYYYSTPYGLDGANELHLYLPGTLVSELPEEYMNWIWSAMENPDAAELPFYGLYNVSEQNGFSSYKTSSGIDDLMASTEECSIAIKTSLEQDDLNQTEMNTKSKELYDTWDAALNTLWKELKEKLSEEEFSKLLEEQRAWISQKEKAVEESGKEYEGGSMYSLVVNRKAAEITEERVYELYEKYYN